MLWNSALHNGVRGKQASSALSKMHMTTPENWAAGETRYRTHEYDVYQATHRLETCT